MIINTVKTIQKQHEVFGITTEANQTVVWMAQIIT